MNNPRPAEDNIPYRDRSVSFVQWQPGRTITSSHYLDDKRTMLEEDLPLFAAWTGRYRTDLFEIDRKAARKALA